MILGIGLWTFLRAVLFGSAAIALPHRRSCVAILIAVAPDAGASSRPLPARGRIEKIGPTRFLTGTHVDPKTVQTWLDHAQITTTLGIYAHSDEPTMLKAARKLERGLQPKNRKRE